MPKIYTYRNGVSFVYSPEEEERFRNARIKIAKYYGHTDGRQCSYDELFKYQDEHLPKYQAKKREEAQQRAAAEAERKRLNKIKWMKILTLGLYKDK